MKVLRAQPNAAHLAITTLEQHVPELTVITQNVDDLHERAGSTEVLHLHGSLHAPRGATCDLDGQFWVLSNHDASAGNWPMSCVLITGARGSIR